MRIQILHNVAQDHLGRPLGLIDGYRSGHELVEVFAYDGPAAEVSIKVAAEDAFHRFNIGHDPDWGTPDPIALAYRATMFGGAGLRSLSTGDVVIVDGTALACASVGWKVILHPLIVEAGELPDAGL